MPNLNQAAEQIVAYLNNNRIKYKVSRPADTRWILDYYEPTAENEHLSAEISLCECCSDKNSVTKVWEKHRWIEKGKLKNGWISLHTYARDEHGNEFGKYNPQLKVESEINPFSKETVYFNTTDFDWIEDAGSESLNTLLQEVERRAYGHPLESPQAFIPALEASLLPATQ